MSLVQYRPGSVEAHVANLTSFLSNMKQAGEDEMASLAKLNTETAGQFTDVINAQRVRITQIQQDAEHVVNQIITSVVAAKDNNHARDVRSANSIG